MIPDSYQAELQGIPNLVVDNDPTKQSAPAPRVDLHGHGEVRVLVVDDNPVSQRLASRLLEKAGYRVSVAATGLQAVGEVHTARRAYHVVLMDLQMPEMDGLEATARIRALEQERGCRPVRIIAMTAHAMTGDRERCLQSGMDDYLAKPINPQELTGLVETWARVAVGGDKVGPSAPEGEPPAADLPRLDLASALRYAGGDREVLAEVLEAFRKHAVAMLEALLRAESARNPADVQAAAHEIRGAAASIGGESLRSHSLFLESLCRKGQFDGLVPAIRRLEEELRLLVDEIGFQILAAA